MESPDERALRDRLRKSTSTRERRQLRREGRDSCTVCGWKGPKSLRYYVLVQPHHIKGVSTKELIQDRENMVPLCPNHHRIAELAFRPHNDPPPTADEVIRRLKAMDEEKD